MPNPTSIEELLNIPFLKMRLDAMQKAIALSPASTALWVGAGYSSNLEGLPTWRKFLLESLENISDSQKEYLIVKSIIEAGRLQLAAEYLYQLLGDSFFTNISNTFGRPNYINKMAIVSKFCVSRIITTNYDSVLENSMRYYKVRTPLDSIETLLSSEFNLIKLHGSAENPESCVLTISSYAKTYNREFEWYLINMFLTNTVIFIGASMDQSEPFFKSIMTIKRFNSNLRKHYAIVAVENNNEAKELGKRLEKMGIYLIPYVPDNHHSILDKLLNYLSEYVYKPDELNSRMVYLRLLLKEARFIEVAVFLHNMCQDEANGGWNSGFADLINKFLTELFNQNNADEQLRTLKKIKLNISNIIRTASNLKDIKVSALEGFILAFNKLAKFDGENYQIDIKNIRDKIKFASIHRN